MFSADRAQQRLTNLRQVRMKWCFQVGVKPVVKHLETTAPLTLFYSSRGCNLPCYSEDWQRNGNIASLRFLFYLLICKAAVLAIGKCQWLFVQEPLSSLP